MTPEARTLVRIAVLTPLVVAVFLAVPIAVGIARAFLIDAN